MTTRAWGGAARLGLRPPVRGGVLERQEVPLEVDVDDRVPVVLAEVDEHAVAQEPGVVDERVQPPVGLQGEGRQGGGALGGGDVAAVRDGPAAAGADLLGDPLGRGRRVAFPAGPGPPGR
ncbi:hypothetical protein GCM10020000_10600 [Streptomyces olivoverticillatus]